MEIESLKLTVAKGLRVVEDFMPNIGQCALQNYGELNEFLMEADVVVKAADKSEAESPQKEIKYG